MEGAEIIFSDAWWIAELESRRVAMARNGQRDTLEYESLLDQIDALKEIQESEPGHL